MKINPKALSPHPILSLQSWVGVLLLLYVFIYLIPPGLIPHSHHEHIGKIVSSIEQDPCHITIYHPNIEGGCHHKFHITKDPGDCHLCHVSIVRQIVPDPIETCEVIYYTIVYEIICPPGNVVQFPILHDDRGPPASFIL